MSPDASPPTLAGPVLIIGCGLVGTSVGLALDRVGAAVHLRDAQPEHARTAQMLGAGTTEPPESVSLVVVAVPPDFVAEVVAGALAEWPTAVVTDVASVKLPPLEALASAGTEGLERYVGSHPMAGSERSGPLAGSASLFDGRPWAITPHLDSAVEAVELVEELVRLCGATPVWLTPEEHDRAVARTSHVPHLIAATVASRLATAPENHLALSGQGVRDVTRVAGGDPALYGQIVTGNAEAVLALLGEVREQLDRVIAAVGAGDRDALESLLAEGVAGTRAIPGKHGGPPRPMGSVWVSVPDVAGELARLLADAVASEVNIEDIRIDHDPARPVGLVELLVEESRVEHLLGSLESRGWVTHR